MAIESEIERLVVRLTGDNKDYKKMLHNSTVETQRFVDKGGKLHDKLTGKFVAGQKRIRSSLEITGTALKKFWLWYDFSRTYYVHESYCPHNSFWDCERLQLWEV